MNGEVRMYQIIVTILVAYGNFTSLSSTHGIVKGSPPVGRSISGHVIKSGAAGGSAISNSNSKLWILGSRLLYKKAHHVHDIGISSRNDTPWKCFQHDRVSSSVAGSKDGI